MRSELLQLGDVSVFSDPPGMRMLTHVYGTVVAHHGAENGEKSNHETCTRRTPATTIGNVEQSSFGAVLGCHSQ